MKILRLQFKNLNSLYGEWIIDFTNPEYTSNGIFAMTGATGAGKSTILDAICLALYGATPRLGKITKSTNDIMSRQTGECYAEVTFESQAGKFICHWEQHCAKKKAGGNLQEQKHEIADAETGKVIENKKSLVINVIEEKTGMDFERFTRSTMLAQGNFDKFLKADIGKKSEILEQITGTEIYSKISQHVYKRQKDEKEKLDSLSKEYSGIEIIEPEKEKIMQQQLTEKEKELKNLNKTSKATEKAINWLKIIEDLQQQEINLNKESIRLKKDITAFEPDSIKLEWAIKANSLDGIYSQLKEIRQQQANDKNNFNTKNKELPKLQKSTNEQETALETAKKMTKTAKANLANAVDDIKQTRALDQIIAKLKKDISETNTNYENYKTQIDEHEEEKEEKEKQLTDINDDPTTIEQYLKDNSCDEWLVNNFTGIKEQLNNLTAKQKYIKQKESAIETANTTLKNAKNYLDKITDQIANDKQNLTTAENNLQQGKDVLNKLLDGKLLREYRTEKDNLLNEKAYIPESKTLKDYRAKLEDGKRCSLCGATEHPFAKGNIPQLDEVDKQIAELTKLILKAEEYEENNKILEKELISVEQQLEKSNSKQDSANKDKETAENRHKELTESLQELQDDFGELKQKVLSKLKPLDITEILENNIPSLLENLKSRLDAWQQQVDKKTKITKQIYDQNGEINILKEAIKTKNKTLAEIKKKLDELKNECTSENEKRINLFADKNPDTEEKRLNQAITDAETAETEARDLDADCRQNLTKLETEINTLQQRIKENVPKLQNTEKDFASKLIKKGFQDEKHFTTSIIEDEEQEKLSVKAQQLHDKKTELETKQQEIKQQLDTEKAKKITDKTLDQLEPQIEEIHNSISNINKEIGSDENKLDTNKKAKKQKKEKQQVIDAQQQEYTRWDNLNDLIGSADGKKYRNFAQGLTFELMVAHANNQLEKITDRYLLMHDNKNPLELNVIDNYQASEIRSIKNLSGGESFIVCLTLALGLAKMTSNKVRVDSLFIDEGFGTLDEQALEIALDTLAGLQHDGKLIGIISHVAALKERIPTQITIESKSQGRSVLAGPGCLQV